MSPLETKQVNWPRKVYTGKTSTSRHCLIQVNNLGYWSSVWRMILRMKTSVHVCGTDCTYPFLPLTHNGKGEEGKALPHNGKEEEGKGSPYLIHLGKLSSFTDISPPPLLFLWQHPKITWSHALLKGLDLHGIVYRTNHCKQPYWSSAPGKTWRKKCLRRAGIIH